MIRWLVCFGDGWRCMLAVALLFAVGLFALGLFPYLLIAVFCGD